MWREHEEDAFYMGLSMSEYWNMNRKQYDKYSKVFEKKIEDELVRSDVLNHALGRYIAIAFHDPKKYPEKPFSYKEEQKDMTDDEMEKQAMRITMALGGKVNGINT